MNRAALKNLSIALARGIVGGLFLYAAFPKMNDALSFARDIDNYRLLPAVFSEVFGTTLPYLEATVGLALVVGFWSRGASLVSMALLATFAAAMVQAIVRGIDLECGCFGKALQAQVTWWTVLRNAALVLLSLWSLFGDNESSPLLLMWRSIRKKSQAEATKSD